MFFCMFVSDTTIALASQPTSDEKATPVRCTCCGKLQEPTAASCRKNSVRAALHKLRGHTGSDEEQNSNKWTECCWKAGDVWDMISLEWREIDTCR